MNLPDFLLGFAVGGMFVAVAFWHEWQEIEEKRRRAKAIRRSRGDSLNDKLLLNMLHRAGRDS
jgi:hypothetical protein